MPFEPLLVLILDGNNLAHHLNPLPFGSPVTTRDVQHMAMHLSQYVRTARRPVRVELCLDHFHPDHEMPVLGGVRIFAATPPEEADDLLLQHFWYHQHSDHRCLVITNDSEVHERVQEEGGECLLVYDFVRRTGKKPVFRDPLEFARLVRRGKEKEDHEPAFFIPPSVAAPTLPLSESPIAAVPAPLIPDVPSLVTAASLLDEPEPPAEALPPEPAYQLTLETWPLEAGVRFLVKSFCPQHGAEYRELYPFLMADELRPADLFELANALVSACGSEPDFATQGSLLNRVRLALLLSPLEAVPLSVIAMRTGFPVKGLHGRIKEKAGSWLKIVNNPL